ncbi:hypothetical protein GGF32_009217 [Allomyces javanicus]|nr:hypothetical protein GGF32_009217 [Allomyces javanicus]
MTSTSRAGMDPHLGPRTERLDYPVFPPHPSLPVDPAIATPISPVPSFTHHGPINDEDPRHDGHGGVASQPSSPPRKYRTILPSSAPAPPPVDLLGLDPHDPPDSLTCGTSEPRSHSPDPTTHELRPRKKRNMYTPQQRDVLVHYFETVTDHPTKDQRKHLIKLVGTDDQTVRVWFQNYRAKVQRDVKHVDAPAGGACWPALVVAGYPPVLIPTGAAATGPNVVGFVVPPGYAGPAPAPVPGYAWVATPLAPEYAAVPTTGPLSPVHQVAPRACAPSPPPFAAIPTTTDSAQCVMQLVDRPLSLADGPLSASPVSRHARDKAKNVPHASRPSSASAHATLVAAIPTPPLLPLPVPSDGGVMHGGVAAAALSKSLGRSRGSPIKRCGGGDAPSSPSKRAKHEGSAGPAHALVAQLSALGLATSPAESVPAVHSPGFVLPDAVVETVPFYDESSAVLLPDALPARNDAVGGVPAFSDLVDAALAMDLDMALPDPVPLPFPTGAVPLPTGNVLLPPHTDAAEHLAPPPPAPFHLPPDRTRWIKADADSMLDVTAETPFRDAAASPSVLFGSAGTVGDDSPDALLGVRLGAGPADVVRDVWADASVPEPLDVDVALQQWAEAEPGGSVVAGKDGDAAARPGWMAGGTLGLALGSPDGANDRVDSGPRLAM